MHKLDVGQWVNGGVGKGRDHIELFGGLFIVNTH